MFIDGGIHKVHFLRYLAGEPEHLFAAALPRALDGHQGEDGLVMVAKWPGGLVGLVNHAWVGSNHHLPPWVAVSGTGGRVYFELGEPWLRLEQGSRERVIRLEGDRFGLGAMVREFRDSIRQGRPPEVPGSEGLRDLALVLKAYESVERGVSLPFSPRD